MQNIEETIDAYTISALAHGKATEEGDAERANQAHDSLIAAYRMLCESGRDGLVALLPLMEHEDESVRCWSATHCLKLDAPRAERVLRELTDGPSAVAFTAEIVLSEWKQGTPEIPS
jgi:hypothetical protein